MSAGAPVVLTAVLLAALPAGAEPCAVSLASQTAGVDAVVDAYRKLLEDVGRGVLTEGDLRSLRRGSRFDLDPQGRVEAVPVAEGLAALGHYVERHVGDSGALNEKLDDLLAVRLDSATTGRMEQARVVENQQAVESPIRTIPVGDVHDGTWNLSGDGRRMAQSRSHGGSWYPRLRLFDVDSGTLLLDLTLQEDLGNAFLDFRGEQVATKTWNGRVKFWKVTGSPGVMKLQLLGELKRDDQQTFLGFVDGGKAALVGFGGRIHAVQVSDGSIRNSVPFPEQPNGKLAFSHDGKRFAVGAGETVEVYGEELWNPSANPTEPLWRGKQEGTKLESLRWDRNGRLYAAVGENGKSKVIVREPDFALTATLSYPGIFRELAVSPDGRYVAISETPLASGVAMDPILRVRRTGTGEEVLTVAGLQGFHELGFEGNDHLWLKSGDLRIWKLGQERSVYRSDPLTLGGVVADAANSRLIEYALGIQSLRVWSLRTILREAQ